MRQLWKWVFGNGDKGTDERLRKVEDTMSTLTATLQRLEAAEQARSAHEKATKRERRGFSTRASC